MRSLQVVVVMRIQISNMCMPMGMMDRFEYVAIGIIKNMFVLMLVRSHKRIADDKSRSNYHEQQTKEIGNRQRFAVNDKRKERSNKRSRRIISTGSGCTKIALSANIQKDAQTIRHKSQQHGQQNGSPLWKWFMNDLSNHK